MTEGASHRIRDLVELPEVRTVIQLADLDDPELSSRILEDFVLTTDCDFALSALLESMTGEAGEGAFLQGNFGSGKSHFLAVLSLLLQSDQAWEVLSRPSHEAQESGSSDYPRFRRRLSPRAGPNVVASVSLVEHAGSERLEDICLAALGSAVAVATGPLGLGPSFAAEPRAVEEIRAALESRHREALEAFLGTRSVDASRLFDPARPDLLDELVLELELPFRVRRERAGFFTTLASALGQAGRGRAVLILDELSEFLRSKPDGRAFNEDIRFLQFLGEVSLRMPLWIVASLQEQIEATGEIDQTTFGKIKDRYPLRLSLTGRHLRELAATRLIRKKPGAEGILAGLYRRTKQAFGGLDVSEAEFIALYPVHPATVDLLDDLLPLFSRHRGAVDFLHYQLAGDPHRRIPGILDEPAETLLAPDTILDHFRIRIQETVETSSFITVVLAFYEKELPRLFPDGEDRATALRLLKILILTALSPIRRRRSVARLAEMLLYRVTHLDPAANYDYVRDLLEKMRREGAYLALEAREEPTGDPHQDVYTIDLAADVQLIIQRRIEALLKDPGFTFGRAFERLLPGFASPLLPLASLASAPRTTRRVSWQRTRREGLLIFCRGEEDPRVSEESLDAIHEQLATTELDFCILLLAPQADGGSSRPSSTLPTPGGLLARLRDRGAEPYLVWQPQPLDEDAVAVLRKAAARLMVRDHFRQEGSEVGKRVLEALGPAIQDDRGLCESLVQRAYREGSFLSPLGAPALSPAELPSLPFDRLLERMAEFPLQRRYPRHYLIAPSLELPATETVQQMVGSFLRVGEVPARELTDALRRTLDAHLRPLGLVKRTASGYRLQADPKQGELVRCILDRVASNRVALDGLYQELRKGPFGLVRAHFDLAMLALAYSGQLTVFAKGRKVRLDTLDERSLRRADHVGPGEMLSRELQSVLAGLPFVPPRFREGAFGFAQQRELWEICLQWKGETERRLADLGAELERARSYRSAAHLDVAGLSERLEGVRKILAEVKSSYPAREGLERLALACRQEPEIERILEDFDRLATFFREDWERYLFIQRYLGDGALEFPDGFDELGRARDRLRKLAARPDVPLVPEVAGQLKEGLGDFLAAYGRAYEREHERQKSTGRLDRLLRVRESRGYDLLRRLSEIRLVSVHDDRVKIDRLVEGALARTCSRLSPEFLRSKPTCECGFRLGDEVELPSVTEVQASIERGGRQYLAALREVPYREKVEASLFGLKEVGKGSLAEKIQRLLELDPESPEAFEEAHKLVDRDVIAAMNDALAGSAVLVDRDLDDLAESLLDRSFPKAKLLELVERWVDRETGLGPEDYVRVVSRSAGAAGAESRLGEFLASRYPELLPWWQERGASAGLQDLVFAYRGEAGLRGLEGRLTPLMAEAVETFVREEPEGALEALDAAERAVSSRERDALLSPVRGQDDPAELLQAAFGERAFRFVVREVSGKLFRMLLSETHAARLGEALEQAKKRVSHGGPLERRLGIDVLARGLARGVAISKTTAFLHGFSGRRGEEPDKWQAWQKIFLEYLASSEMALAELEEATRLLQIHDRVDLAALVRPARKALAEVGEAFEQFYLGALPSWGEREKDRPAMLADVFADLRRRFERKLKPAARRFVMMDGLRWDVWAHLKENVLPGLRATYRVVEEVPLWSVHPTTTKVQLERAGLLLPEPGLRAAEAAGGYGAPRPGREDTEPSVAPGFLSLAGPQGELVERLNLVDDKIHESTADLVDLFGEIALHSRRTLAVLLEEEPRGSLVFIFSDHGFREDPHWKPKAQKGRARYRHGGASPWEVITPLAVLYRV